MYSEQRRHPRVPLYVEVSFGEVAEDVTEYILNISRGGLFIETFSPLKPGALLQINFYLPDAGHSFNVTGSVAWSRNMATAAGPPGMGIQFQDISQQDADLLDEYVHSRLSLEEPG